jgi:hypothetical protein
MAKVMFNTARKIIKKWCPQCVVNLPVAFPKHPVLSSLILA